MSLATWMMSFAGINFRSYNNGMSLWIAWPKKHFLPLSSIVTSSKQIFPLSPSPSDVVTPKFALLLLPQFIDGGAIELQEHSSISGKLIGWITHYLIWYTGRGWIKSCLATSLVASEYGWPNMSQEHAGSMHFSPSGISWLSIVARLVRSLVRQQHTSQSAPTHIEPPNITSQLSNLNHDLMTITLTQSLY